MGASRLDELERENVLLREANRRLQAQGEDLERDRLVQQLRAVIEYRETLVLAAEQYLTSPWYLRLGCRKNLLAHLRQGLAFNPSPARPSNELRALRRFYLDVRALCQVPMTDGPGWIPEPWRRKVLNLVLAAENGGATATPPDAAP